VKLAICLCLRKLSQIRATAWSALTITICLLFGTIASTDAAGRPRVCDPIPEHQSDYDRLETGEVSRLLLKERTPALDLEYEELRFSKRFNSLVRALQDFAETYNAGEVIDAKRAKKVRKAMRQLRSLDWFKDQGDEKKAVGQE
jgi:hypothetical protein